MDTKLDSLRIKNFRVFEELILPRVGRVNLIVGKNNSGKTCLLEALRIYAGNANPQLLFRLVEDRHETLPALVDLDTPTVGDASDMPWSNPLRNLFAGYRFPTDFTKPIEIGPADSDRGVYVSLAAYRDRRNDESGNGRELLSVATMAEMPADAELHLGAGYRAHNTSGGISVPLSKAAQLRSWTPKNEDSLPGARFVPASGWRSDEIAAQWARVVVRPKLRDHIVKALQLIAPGIREVVFVPTGKGKSEPVVIYDDTRSLPLRGLGDGASRLFQMMLALVVTRGGLVLFDEFENGLHWSVQPQAWDLIFHLATTLDLQVFATTHSWDCVRAFQAATEKSGRDGMLFRLGASVRKSTKGKIIATSYGGEDLARATRAGLEVR